MSFSADITRWVKKTELSGAAVMQKIGLDAIRGVQLRSPVDTGRFRASHRVGVNEVDSSVEPERGALEGGGGAPRESTGAELAAALGRLGRARWGDTIRITNNLPYARPLENGSSAQNGHQPDGIYGATAAELQAKIEQLVRSARL